MESDETLTIVGAEPIADDPAEIRVATADGRTLAMKMDLRAGGELTMAVTASLQRQWEKLDDSQREAQRFGLHGAIVASALTMTVSVDTGDKRLVLETYGAPIGLSLSLPVSEFAEYMDKWQNVAREISEAGLATVPPKHWRRPVISDGMPVPGTRVVTVPGHDAVAVEVSPPGGNPASPDAKRLVVHVDQVDALIAALAEGKALVERRKAGAEH